VWLLEKKKGKKDTLPQAVEDFGKDAAFIMALIQI
jgi:hypothetical protein